jgi:hypothetical protein
MLPDVATQSDFLLPGMTLGYRPRAVIGQSHAYGMSPLGLTM